MSKDLEEQIATLADAAFEQTSPVRYDAYVGDHATAESVPTRRWLMVAAASVLVLALVGAVALFDGSDAVPVVDTAVPITTEVEQSTTEPVGPAPDFSSDFSARGVLSQIPWTADEPAIGWRVGGADFATISELTGIERRDQSPSGWFDLLFIQGSVVTPESTLMIEALRQPDAFESEFGFSVLDVDRYATADNYLGSSLDTLSWPFDSIVLDHDMATLAENAGADSIIDIGQGVDDQRSVTERTDFRPIGRPLRVGVDESRSRVSVSKSTPLVAAWLTSDGSTLEDVADLAAAAAVLDGDAELLAAQFKIFNRDVDDFELETVSDFPIVEEFTTMALGSSGVDESQRTTIVYVFADERAAAASIVPIRRLFAPDTEIRSTWFDDLETVGDVLLVDEVAVEGRAVAVSGRAEPGRADAVRRLFLQELDRYIAHR